MRDLETVDQELRLLAVVREVVRHSGGRPTTDAVDELRRRRRVHIPSSRPLSRGGG